MRPFSVALTVLLDNTGNSEDTAALATAVVDGTTVRAVVKPKAERWFSYAAAFCSINTHLISMLHSTEFDTWEKHLQFNGAYAEMVRAETFQTRTLKDV